ncbi:sulfotransferase family protein [Jatrophihabitans fulvus]
MSAEPQLPGFIVIGAMKSGTTSLCAYLGEHPGVFFSIPKEPDFFVASPNDSRNLAWYRALFASAPPGALCGEGSTNYTKAASFPGVPERIHTLLPAVKLVYLLRDPVERLRSHYVHNRLSGREQRAPADAIVPGSGYVDTSLYGRQLSLYRQVFPAEQMLVVLSEDLKRDPSLVLTRVHDFLDLEPTPATSAARRDNDSSQRRTVGRLGASVKSHPRLLRWARNSVPLPVRGAVARMLSKDVDIDEYDVPREVISRLGPTLLADRELLEGLCGVDLRAWSPPGA